MKNQTKPKLKTGPINLPLCKKLWSALSSSLCIAFPGFKDSPCMITHRRTHWCVQTSANSQIHAYSDRPNNLESHSHFGALGAPACGWALQSRVFGGLPELHGCLSIIVFLGFISSRFHESIVDVLVLAKGSVMKRRLSVPIRRMKHSLGLTHCNELCHPVQVTPIHRPVQRRDRRVLALPLVVLVLVWISQNAARDPPLRSATAPVQIVTLFVLCSDLLPFRENSTDVLVCRSPPRHPGEDAPVLSLLFLLEVETE
mmetsp:Transcript_590/g.1104  ORF Transcript_590/g.1104 Transcript_590/m.1104 type:complete len:257 (-) Transcript_590:633-1403(-)